MSLSVSQSLRGKSVLITGTTGFVGKVLVEKILRDIPDVGKLFLLIRGKSASERLEKEIIESKIFTRFVLISQLFWIRKLLFILR